MRLLLLFACLFALVAWSAPIAATGPPVCVFDIDQTLTRMPLSTTSACGVKKFESLNWLRLAGAYARAAIAGCFAAGYEVAIATAEPKLIADFTTQWLTDLSNNKFSSAFFKSPAFGYGLANKTTTLLNIAKFFNSTSNCIILFDDQLVNDATANAINMLSQEASISCGGTNGFCLTACGLTQPEFESGIAKLAASCPVAALNATIATTSAVLAADATPLLTNVTSTPTSTAATMQPAAFVSLSLMAFTMMTQLLRWLQ